MKIDLIHEDEDGVIYKIDRYEIPDNLKQDLINWLEWAVKQGERNKKWEEANVQKG